MFFIRLFSRIPLPVLYFWGDVMAFIIFHIIRYRRKVVEKNLALAFPEKSLAERYKIAKRFYINLGELVVESIKSLTISREDMQRRVVIKNPEVLDNRLEKGTSVIVLTSHNNNWEWLLLGWSVHLKWTVDAVYKPISFKPIDHFMTTIRSRFGAVPIPMNNILREAILRKNDPRVIALVADQRPWGTDSNYWTTFFDKDTPFFNGGERLAKKMQFPIIYATLLRRKRGYYEAVAYELEDPPYTTDGREHTATQKFVEIVENQIRQYPDNWLWTHDRWRHGERKQSNNNETQNKVSS
ncbi:MAG: hypothetical protein EAZ55_11495 [Cytophagales bacterium]|nr:MAG: hypothetical protein EAZ55_11495 [Cytophagales bacterium]